MGKYEIRPYRPGDEHAILSTFERVFGESHAPGASPPTLADWRWTYADNPAGMRVWLALDGDVVAAHYASQPRRARVEGETHVFAQIIDSMVHPDHRGGLKSPGIFAETGRRLLESTCGTGKDLVAYGWPTRVAWRMGRALMGYELVRRETSLSVEPGPGSSELPAGIEELSAVDARVPRLYERCARHWPASTIRDATYLDWRVLRRPGRPYRWIAAPDGRGELAGYAITRLSDWPVEHALVLCDWLVAPEELEAADALLEGVRVLARAQDARLLIAVFPAWSPWFRHFREQGFFAAESDYHMVSGTYNDPRYDCAWLREHWWYQPLDLDLF